MKILISNDDGIDSPGIQRLAESVLTLGDVPSWRRTGSGAPRAIR